jgi:DNA mismatch repair protein MutS
LGRIDGGGRGLKIALSTAMEFAEIARPGLITPNRSAALVGVYMSTDRRDRSPSVLFDTDGDRHGAARADAPIFLGDLNLDQIIEAVTSDWSEYDLKTFFSFPLNRTGSIQYRHEVFQDLEDPALFEQVESFARRMRNVRMYVGLANKLYYRFHKEGWFLQAVNIYCDAITQLAIDLADAPLKSHGFIAFRDYMISYAAGTPFAELAADAKQIAAELSCVKYSILVRDSSFTVRADELEADYSTEIEETFEKFQQGSVKDYRVKYRNAPEDMNHIEAKILEFVARLNPDLFSRLVAYCTQHVNFVDETVAVFDREIHFYIAYLEHIARFKKTGLKFSYPEISARSKSVHARDAFDLALAQKLVEKHRPIVCNDFFLQGKERIIVVTGPNQGGKTTFARMFGQLHYLAKLGCPVPAADAQLFLFDQLFTHFEREEKVENLRGKLEDDLVRVHAILQQATSRSIIVMNEIFTSTTVQDELFLSRRVMEQLNRLDLLSVWVTFLDELASSSDNTVSMVSTIVPDNPALRTFKIARRAADGLAYAMAIAQKYHLSYDRIRERIVP